jgi:hypothetical protein
MKDSNNFPEPAACRDNIDKAFESSRDRSVQGPYSAATTSKSWRDLERAMDRARDLRALHCAALLAAAFHRIRISSFGRTSEVSPRRLHAAARAVLVACATALAAAVIFSGIVFAEEPRKMSARTANPSIIADDAVLAELGLTTAVIETCTDVDLLWRAVRELVLPNRISEPRQQLILRRVWVIDPDIGNSRSPVTDTH